MQSACAVLYCHLWPVRVYNIFPHYLINGAIFETKVTEHKMCFDFLYNFETFTNLRRIQRDVITNLHNLQVKNPSMLADFNDYRKTLKFQIS